MELNWRRLLEGGQERVLFYIAGGITGVLMLFMILCNLLLIVSNMREPNQMPSVFGIRPAIVLSGSMEPTFYPGDVILLKKTKEPEKLEVGDVVCYLYSGKATTHRITERFEADGKTRYVMKGDFNNVEDRLAVDPEQIQGVWTGGRIPHLGRFLMFLQSTWGMFLFLICPLAGVLSWDILKRRREEALRREAWENGEAGAYGEPEPGFMLGRELRRISGLGRKREDRQSDGPTEDQKYRRLEEELEAYRRREEAQRTQGETEYPGRQEESRRTRRMAEEMESRGRSEESGYWGGRETVEARRGLEEPEYLGGWETADSRRKREAARYRERPASMEETGWPEDRPDRRIRGRGLPGGRRYERVSEGQDEEFAYYAGQDEALDYFEELEEAAQHYRRMKESLARYRRMEAVMNRCRRLEEELARYEALADRLENYERRRSRSRPDDIQRNGFQEGAVRTAATRQGVSNQGMESESSVDHIDRQTRSEKPE